MKVLVINAGSSSLKYQLFDMDKVQVLAKGNCERIGIDGVITHKCTGKDEYQTNADFPNHRSAIEFVLSLLTDENLGVISSVDEISAVGHRFAHGGEKLRVSAKLGEEEIDYLESIVGLNPLHGPPAISGFKACKEVMPNVEHVGVFDTSYYSDMPPKSYIYPIPYEFYEEYKIRRYGFHGTSHRFVANKAKEMLGNPNAKIITCHLGNGSSITATVNGKAIDTSMGFTPQDGVPMGTRSGAIDPTIVSYIQKVKGISPDEVDNILNKKSGLLGVSGVSSDGRDIHAGANDGNQRCQLAIDILAHSIKKIIGSYVAEMNGVDALVFTAGIGENDRVLRQLVCDNMSYLGIEVDKEINQNCPRGEVADISAKGSKVKTFVIPTNEEYMIALDTLNLVK